MTEFSEAVQRRVKERGISYAEALGELGRERPDLYARHRASVMQVDVASLAGPPSEERRVVASEDDCLSAQARMLVKTRKRVREKGISFAQALSEIGTEFPQLYEEARQEALRDK